MKALDLGLLLRYNAHTGTALQQQSVGLLLVYTYQYYEQQWYTCAELREETSGEDLAPSPRR